MSRASGVVGCLFFPGSVLREAAAFAVLVLVCACGLVCTCVSASGVSAFISWCLLRMSTQQQKKTLFLLLRQRRRASLGSMSRQSPAGGLFPMGVPRNNKKKSHAHAGSRVHFLDLARLSVHAPHPFPPACCFYLHS